MNLLLLILRLFITVFLLLSLLDLRFSLFHYSTLIHIFFIWVHFMFLIVQVAVICAPMIPPFIHVELDLGRFLPNRSPIPICGRTTLLRLIFLTRCILRIHITSTFTSSKGHWHKLSWLLIVVLSHLIIFAWKFNWVTLFLNNVSIFRHQTIIVEHNLFICWQLVSFLWLCHSLKSLCLTLHVLN